eukprot:141836_1
MRSQAASEHSYRYALSNYKEEIIECLGGMHNIIDICVNSNQLKTQQLDRLKKIFNRSSRIDTINKLHCIMMNWSVTNGLKRFDINNSLIQLIWNYFTISMDSIL